MIRILPGVYSEILDEHTTYYQAHLAMHIDVVLSWGNELEAGKDKEGHGHGKTDLKWLWRKPSKSEALNTSIINIQVHSFVSYGRVDGRKENSMSYGFCKRKPKPLLFLLLQLWKGTSHRARAWI
jgi:hypothetical protein